MDYEDMNTTTEENTTETEIPNIWAKRIQSHEVLFIICCILAIIADVVIASTILRFKQMRIPSNIPIANWAIMDLCFLLVMLSGYRIMFNIVERHNSFCFINQIAFILHLMIIVSVYFVLVNWCVAAYFTKCLVRIKICITLELVTFWTTVLIFVIIMSTECVEHIFTMGISPTGFVILFPLLIGIAVIRLVNLLRKYRGQPVEYPKLALNLCTSFIICYAVATGNYVFGSTLWRRNEAFELLMMCPAFCNSLITLSLLCFCYKSFQLHLKKTFQWKFRRPRNSFDINESLEQEQFSEVSLHCPAEQLRTNK